MGEHEQIDLLIPWYVNGTLNEAEMDAINAHLQSCADCRSRVASEVNFARRLREAPAALDALPVLDSGRNVLLARLDQLTATSHRRRSRALPMLLLAVAAVSFLAGRQADPGAGEGDGAFETLTTPQQQGPILQLLFRPDTAPARIEEVLGAAGALRIHGPSAGGTYRLVLPRGRDVVAETERLQGLAGVRWVGPEAP